LLTIIATKNKLFPQSRENSLFLVGNLWGVFNAATNAER
jgi:hypothetical protein